MIVSTPVSPARRAMIDDFLRQQPQEAALLLDKLPASELVTYLEGRPPETAVSVLERLNAAVVPDLLRAMDDRLFVALFSGMDTHLAARLLSRLPQKDIASGKLALLPERPAAEIREFMTYRPQTAGYLMDTSIVSFHLENTVQDVLDGIRKLADRRINAVFLTDGEGRLMGKASLQSIATSNPTLRMKSVSQPAPAVNALASREDALAIVTREDLLQLPVTDINGKLLGVIRNDALIEATKREVAEEMQLMFGASREEQALSSVGTAVKSRLPWLQINLATAFLASFIVGLFEDTIAQITILAVFLPVVAGQSGNTGSQALAVTMRGLALREVRVSQWLVVARKEIFVGLINGVAVALTTGLIVFFWSSSAGIALVIGISMVFSMMVAGFAGAVIPIALKAIGQDPATSSSIILTTVTDITGFLSFLGLATALAAALGIV